MSEVLFPTYHLRGHQQRIPSGLGRQDATVSTQTLIFVLLLHIPLALLIYQFKAIAMAHAIGCLALGVWWASTGHVDRAMYMAAYVVGAEVLWRLSGGSIVHEFGKYSVVLILGTLLLKMRRPRVPLLAVFYFLLLLPSIALTLSGLELNLARQRISSVLSGPLAILVCIWFFSNVRLSHKQLNKLFFSLIVSCFAISVITLFSTLSASSINFITQSMVETSGGWGPNQVASALSLGTLCAMWCLLSKEVDRGMKVLCFGLLFFLLIEASMTFSRGGPYMFAIGAIAALVVLFKKERLRILVLTVIFLLALNYIIIPRLDAFTGGAFTVRVLEDTDPSGRDEIALSDIQLWSDNPILGVGPGMSRIERREEFNLNVRDHTEFTRVVAEHGSFGFVALLMFFILIARGIFHHPFLGGRALAASTSTSTWSSPG